MKRKTGVALLMAACFLSRSMVSGPGALAASEDKTVPVAKLLSRHYQDGEHTSYEMRGNNESRNYEIEASGMVRRDSAGNYVEEYAWSHLRSGGADVHLPASSVDFRQTLSLDPNHQALDVPDLSRVSPMLIGPITDLLTFYSDTWLASRQANLIRSGDHAYVKYATPASWADGNSVIVGEDSIDFDITLTSLDTTRQIAKVLVRHVPPAQPAIKLPGAWMSQPVSDTPNNWVQVQKNGDKFVASVGKETFDDRLELSLRDGRILSASLDNPVELLERECTNAALTVCNEGRRKALRRQVEIHWMAER